MLMGLTMLHVVIATRGRPHLLARTLDSLAACDQPASYAGTLVVENGDQQGAERVVHDAPAGLKASYLFHLDGNKSASLNFALRAIDARLIVFLDDDVIVGTTPADGVRRCQRGGSKVGASSADRYSRTTRLRPLRGWWNSCQTRPGAGPWTMSPVR